MKLELFEDLYAEKISRTFDGEKQVLHFFPKLFEAVSSNELREILEQHMHQTQDQIRRLRKLQIFMEAQELEFKSEPVGSMLQEADDLISTEMRKDDFDPDLLDAGLITILQAIEHHEIACYTTLESMSRFLRLQEHQRLIHDTLEEEQQTSVRLLSLLENLSAELVESEVEVG